MRCGTKGYYKRNDEVFDQSKLPNNIKGLANSTTYTIYTIIKVVLYI
jgi:hypothetical protein